MSRKAVVMSTMLSTVIVLSGCSLFGPEKASGPKPTDPPQISQSKPAGSKEVSSNVTPSDVKDAIGGDTAKTAEAAANMPIYMMDPDGYVVPVTLNLPKSEGSAKQIVNYMVKGGPVEDLKPKGFTAVLPEGTKVLGMTIKDGVATVDFSPEFKKYEAKDEQKIIDALTYSLTSMKSIKEVKIWINGHQQDVMPVGGTPITSLSRDNGINLELASNVKMGDTTPVTLYFQAQTPENMTYYVPVTRLIPRTDNKAVATVNELIKGPKQGVTNLFSSILPTTKVLNVKVNNGVAVVDFDDKLLSYNDGKANPQALESLVLSLTENANVGKVQFLVNGKPSVVAGDKDFTKPVSRPQELNPGKM